MTMIDVGNPEIAVDVLTALKRSNYNAGPVYNAAIESWLDDILIQLGAEVKPPVGLDVQRHGEWNKDTDRYSDGESYHPCGMVCSVGAP